MARWINQDWMPSPTSDVFIGMGGANIIDAQEGSDVLLGDLSLAGFFQDFASRTDWTGGSSIATALNLDSPSLTWITGENPLLFDNGVTPYVSLSFNVDGFQSEYLSIHMNAGQTLTVDVDYSGYYSTSVDSIVDVTTFGATVVAHNDDGGTLGGLGSISDLDPFVTFTASVDGTYYIHLYPYGSATFAANTGYILNVSLTGHSSTPSVVSGADQLTGGLGDDQIGGGPGNDQIAGNDGNDRLMGGTGDDTIEGGPGVDIIDGGPGNDIISSGDNGDYLTGGTGNDTFVGTRASLNNDLIWDFTAGDRIVLTDASFAGFNVSVTGTVLTYSGGTMILETVPPGRIVASPAVGAGVQLTVMSSVVMHAGDFNGDTRDDLLWRNDNGALTDWLGTMSGGFAPNGANLLEVVNTSWQVAGIGDFNGDTRDDVLWRRSDGALTDWLGTMTGGLAPNGGNLLEVVDPSWRVVAVGDFNGDTRDDVLWRRNDGALTDWLGTMSGGLSPNAANLLDVVDTQWQIMAVGDFNGDNRDDILWRHSDGRITDWLGTLSGGFTSNAANALSGVSLDWQVAGVGDFNGDNRDDILWRNADGRITDWLGTLNGGFAPNSGNFYTSIGADWQVASIGDFNGDNRDDIVFRNADGRMTDWLGTMTGGFTDNLPNAYQTVDTHWHIQPPSALI